ncbi:MAG: PqqD family protein [Bacteroidales bacterium]
MMMKGHTIDRDTILQRNPDQLFSVIDDEVVMLDIRDEEYLNLNSQASHIWKFLENPCSFGELTDHLCSAYHVEEEECIRDSLEFIIALVQKEIIQIRYD